MSIHFSGRIGWTVIVFGRTCQYGSHCMDSAGAVRRPSTSNVPGSLQYQLQTLRWENYCHNVRRSIVRTTAVMHLFTKEHSITSTKLRSWLENKPYLIVGRGRNRTLWVRLEERERVIWSHTGYWKNSKDIPPQPSRAEELVLLLRHRTRLFGACSSS